MGFKKSYSIKFNGLEPIIIIKKEKEHYKETKEYCVFYFFRVIKGKVEIALLKLKYKLKHYKIIQCEACGFGIAEYYIKSPNKPENWHGKRWKCCRYCVGFYDRHLSRRKKIWK